MTSFCVLLEEDRAKMSISRLEKGGQRLAPTEWTASNEQSCNTTSDLLRRSALNRHDAALLRAEARTTSRWDADRSTDHLADRVSLLQEWLRTLRLTLRRAEQESAALTETKEHLENFLDEALLPPLDVVAQCLHLRDQRPPDEMTIDEVGRQLKDELRTYEQHKSRLAGLDSDAWQMSEELTGLAVKLQVEINELTDALNVDTTALELKITSPNLALRPEPCRTPVRSSAPDAWLSHCEQLVEQQQQRCAASRALREAALLAVEAARNANRAQQEATAAALRRRVHQIKVAITGLDRQRIQILEEMERAAGEAERLEVANVSLQLPSARCETRHEGRTARPAGIQRCEDSAQEVLALESLTLAESQRKLQHNTTTTRAAYERLRGHLAKVELDVERKRAALALELRCLASRQQLERTDCQVVQSHSALL